jgi:hypothetical protein
MGLEDNKVIVRQFIRTVWNEGNLPRIPDSYHLPIRFLGVEVVQPRYEKTSDVSEKPSLILSCKFLTPSQKMMLSLRGLT